MDYIWITGMRMRSCGMDATESSYQSGHRATSIGALASSAGDRASLAGLLITKSLRQKVLRRFAYTPSFAKYFRINIEVPKY